MRKIMSVAITKRKPEKINLFLDYDKVEMTFYNNLYLKDINRVVKIPIKVNKNEDSYDKIKIERFNLVKYTYLTSYDY
jgi:hypothetical protein